MSELNQDRIVIRKRVALSHGRMFVRLLKWASAQAVCNYVIKATRVPIDVIGRATVQHSLMDVPGT